MSIKEELVLRLDELWVHYQANKHSEPMKHLRFGQYAVNELALAPLPSVFYEANDVEAYLKLFRHIIGVDSSNV